jgi:hypothetical protein
LDDVGWAMGGAGGGGLVWPMAGDRIGGSTPVKDLVKGSTRGSADSGDGGFLDCSADSSLSLRFLATAGCTGGGSNGTSIVMDRVGTGSGGRELSAGRGGGG